MSEAKRPRRVQAEIRWAGDSGAIVWVGNRTIHQYWPLLSGYFRDILLPPHRRAEDNAVSWTWHEPAPSKPPSASELATLRKRLGGDHQLFADNLTRGLGASADAGGLRGQGNIDELGATIAASIAQLISRSDDELARFVCRTENGLRVHSWGAPMAATPVYPDVEDREISGHVVLLGESPARHAVLLQRPNGDVVARTTTDAGGAFRFPALTPGSYRLAAEAPGSGDRFPLGGLPVTLENSAVRGIVLRQEAAEPIATADRAHSRGRWILAAVLLAAGLGAGIWGVQRWQSHAAVIARGGNRGGELNSPGALAAAGQASGRQESPGARRLDPVTISSAGNGAAAPGANVAAGLSALGGQSAATSVANAGTVPVATSLSERNLGQPASHLLPGESPGTPRPSAAAPTAATGLSAARAGNAGAASNATSGAASAELAVGGAPADMRPSGRETVPAKPSSPTAALAAIDATPASDHTQPPPPSLEPEKIAPNDRPTQAPYDPPASEAAAIEPMAAGTDSSTVVTGDGVRGGEGEATAHDAAPTTADAGATTAASSSFQTDDAEMKTADGAELMAPSSASERIVAPAVSSSDQVPAGRTATAPRAPMLRVRITPWRARLIQDVVLPTLLVPAGEDEHLAELRARVAAEHASRLPPGFKRPHVTSTVLLAAPAAMGAVAWRAQRGELPAAAWVRGANAELPLSVVPTDAESVFVLVTADELVLAEVRVDPAGCSLRCEAGVLAWQTLALASAESRPEHTSARFQWRTASGLPLPPVWSSGDVAAPRLRIPLGSSAVSAAHALALVDEATGWALCAEVRVSGELAPQ